MCIVGQVPVCEENGKINEFRTSIGRIYVIIALSQTLFVLSLLLVCHWRADNSLDPVHFPLTEELYGKWQQQVERVEFIEQVSVHLSLL